LRTIVNERICRTAFVIQEIHIIGSPRLANEQAVDIVINVNGIADSFLRSQSVCTVLEIQKFFGWQAPPKRQCLHSTKQLLIN
jgi:hypothetical protein